MTLSADRILAELLHSFVTMTSAMDLSTAQTHCELLSSIMYNSDGSEREFKVETTNSSGNISEVAIPLLSLTTPSLLYVSEISFEILGSDVLRIYGEIIRNEKTSKLTPEGKELRNSIAELGYNTDITISGEGNNTRLKFTIYKHGKTMTDHMESWLQQPSPIVRIDNLESI